MCPKIKDSVLILTLAVISPEILSIFGFPVRWNHRIGLLALSLVGIIFMFEKQEQMESKDAIQRVFEEKGIKTKNDQFPYLIKGGKEE